MQKSDNSITKLAIFFCFSLPRVRVFLKHVLDKFLRSGANVSPFWRRKVEFACSHRVKNLSIRIAIERWISTEQNICDHSNGPNVATFRVLPSKYFRRNVVRGTFFQISAEIRWKMSEHFCLLRLTLSTLLLHCYYTFTYRLWFS